MEIKNIVMSIALKDLLTPRGANDLWVHSIRCAVGCRIMAQEQQILNVDDAFLIGFLHDIGKIILYVNDFQEYLQIQQTELLSGRDIIEIENETFATNHCIMGVRILRKWRMPPMLIDCIRYHHTAIMSSLPAICGMLYVCDKFSQNESYKLDLEETVLTRLGIFLPDEKYLREQIIAKSDIYIENVT
jgi:putative nucleotidyltransferase with HDIG domain